jgi:hypothetical protein
MAHADDANRLPIPLIEMKTPTMAATSSNISWIVGVRWLARLWAAGLFVFWGSFFLAHTAEWFFQPPAWPPLWVVALHATHLALLVSWIVGWRWELAGGALSLAAALIFFPQVAGKNAIPFLLVSIVPSLLWIGLSGYAIHRRVSAVIHPAP